MSIDHEAHKIRIKAVSDRMNHPMEYNDAGAPKLNSNLDKIRENTGRMKKEVEASHLRKDLKDDLRSLGKRYKGFVVE